MTFLEIIVLFCLLFICYQDFRYRAVYWICFPLLGTLFLFLKYLQAGAVLSFWHSIVGLSFFALQMLLLWVYFSLKHKKLVNLTHAHLGLGDVLFLAIVPFYLSPVNYVVFYMGSLILVLIYVLVLKLITKKAKSSNSALWQTKQNFQIPLAGLQAMILSAALLWSIFLPQLKLYDDAWYTGF